MKLVATVEYIIDNFDGDPEDLLEHFHLYADSHTVTSMKRVKSLNEISDDELSELSLNMGFPVLRDFLIDAFDSNEVGWSWYSLSRASEWLKGRGYDI